MLHRLLIILIIPFILATTSLYADGFYAPKIDPTNEAQDLTEPIQRAAIIHFRGIERMILQVCFKGNVSEFAWLIPTPAKPELDKSDSYVFYALHAATAPRIKYWLDADMIIHSSGMTFGVSSNKIAESSGVDVLERKIVGSYDTVVLRAKHETDLLNWLHTNGYQVKPTLSPVIADYIKRGWVFTAARINTADRKKSAKRLREGSLEPLQLQFPSKNPVYPLKISSLNPGRTKVLLYVLTDHFVTGSSLRTVCTVDNRTELHQRSVYSMSKSQITNMLLKTTDYRNLETVLQITDHRNRFCITKLAAEFESKQMVSDIVLLRAKSQEAVPPASVSPPFLENLGALVLAPIAIIFASELSFLIYAICLLFAIVHAGNLKVLPVVLAIFGSAMMFVFSFIFSFLWCIIASFVCLIAALILSYRYKVCRGWITFSVSMLALWIPIAFFIQFLNDFGYWPVGLAFLIIAPLITALRLRRKKKLRKDNLADDATTAS